MFYFCVFCFFVLEIFRVGRVAVSFPGGRAGWVGGRGNSSFFRFFVFFFEKGRVSFMEQQIGCPRGRLGVFIGNRYTLFFFCFFFGTLFLRFGFECWVCEGGDVGAAMGLVVCWVPCLLCGFYVL